MKSCVNVFTVALLIIAVAFFTTGCGFLDDGAPDNAGLDDAVLDDAGQGDTVPDDAGKNDKYSTGQANGYNDIIGSDNKRSGADDDYEENEIEDNKEGDKKDNKTNYKDDERGDLQEESSTGKLTGNTEIMNDEKILVVVYYQDKEGFLVPVTRRIPKQPGVARASVNLLKDTAVNREQLAYFELYPVLPQGVEFSINIKDGIAIIDFNNKLLEYNNQSAEINIISSVVYTLTQFETINEVRILINGYIQQRLKYGADISENLSRKNILINAADDKLNLERGMQKLDTYFLKVIKSDICMIPVSIECTDLNEENLQGEIIKNLCKSPESTELFSELPVNTRLIGSSIKDGLLTLNLDIDIGSYGGTQKEHGMINQVLYSMKQIDNIDRVRFLINGEAKAFTEGTETQESIPLPLLINDIVDN